LFQNYDQISLKIGDFNLGKQMQSTANSWVMTLGYQSPEIINSEPHSFKTDVW
jgi:hypothetical protein